MSAILLAPIRVLLALALLGYVFLLLRSGLSKKFLKRCFLVILAGGTAVYMFGFLQQSTTFGIITVMLHSFILSVQMFLGIQQMWDLKEALLIMLGYTPGRQKDDLNKESTQMGRWEDLSEERRHFYRLVIKAMCPKQIND